MVDQKNLDAVRGALGMEKRAHLTGAAEAGAKDAEPAAKAGLTGLRRLLAKKGSLGAVARRIGLSRELSGPPTPPTSQELGQLARHGIDPSQLTFLPSLSEMRSGMNLA